MKLENQVCSLELAQKLKELGVKQESFWYYDPDHHLVLFGGYVTDEYISAYTSAELGEMLPEYLIEGKNDIYWDCDKTNIKGEIVWEFAITKEVYAGENLTENLLLGNEKTEANARAKLLIFLLEQGLINKNDI